VNLEGRTAIVTGGASGFGAGIAARFAAEGARVWIADLDAHGAAETAARLGCLYSVTDVADDHAVAVLAAAALDTLGTVDILVNNAGIGHPPKPLDELAPAEFDRILAVNAKSVYLTSRHVVPAMKRAGRGAILNIASTAGVSPRPNLTWYNASKGFVITATRSMAVELAPWRIRVNALNPVAGETPLLGTFLGEDTPANRARFLSTIPLGRFSTPDDIAAAAAFLCSDEASMITGVCLEVDGGRCI
jgi:3-oxoacyl-[acyl-carrier protein] reductase